MDIEPIWQDFISRLSLHPLIENVYWRKITGIPFIYMYVNQELSKQELEKIIIHSAALSMKGLRLHSETEYVRQEHLLYVYRHRFYVPQTKMFCCGNLCSDCTRLK